MQVSAASPNPSDSSSSRVGLQVRVREDAIASTLQVCASRNLLRWSPVRSLAMPRLRDVLNPCFADIIHQHESQSVRVWPAKLIHARASAIFGDRPFMASLLNCHGVAGNGIRAPDLGLWPCSCNVKRSVGIDRPDRAVRIGPLPGQRGGARGRNGFASSDRC